MADMFAPLVAQLKANPKTIVFTEGNDPRILEAAAKLLAEGVLKVCRQAYARFPVRMPYLPECICANRQH